MQKDIQILWSVCPVSEVHEIVENVIDCRMAAWPSLGMPYETTVTRILYRRLKSSYRNSIKALRIRRIYSL